MVETDTDTDSLQYNNTNLTKVYTIDTYHVLCVLYYDDVYIITILSSNSKRTNQNNCALMKIYELN